MHVYLLTFFLGFFVTYLITPVVRAFAPKIKAIDLPNDRKVHQIPIARLGGVAIYLGFILALAFALVLAYFGGMKLNFMMIFGIVLAGTVLLLVGVVDDIRGLRPTTKLIFQILAVLIVVYFGVEINFINNPFNLFSCYWSFLTRPYYAPKEFISVKLLSSFILLNHNQLNQFNPFIGCESFFAFQTLSSPSGCVNWSFTTINNLCFIITAIWAFHFLQIFIKII